MPACADAAREGAKGDLKGVKIGRVKQFERPGTQDGVKESIDKAYAQLEAQGAEIVEVDCPSIGYALDAALGRLAARARWIPAT